MTDARNEEPCVPEGLEGNERGPGSQGRLCRFPSCATRLSAYNPDRLCWVHGRTVAFARLDRLVAPLQSPAMYRPD